MKNLILGVAKGYDWYTLEPFVNSWRKNCSSAELVLFVDDISDFTRDKLIRESVKLEAFTAQNTPVNARWKFFLDYLQTHEGEYGQIFLTDTRDVIFQADVFDCFKDCTNLLGYATEADDIRGSKTGNYANYIWFTNFFGKDVADKFACKKIICAGTIIASFDAMKIFLSKMFAALNDKIDWGYDQAFMNYLVRENLLPIENLIEIDVDGGEILTCALVQENKTRGNKILRGDGVIPAVVHQYDRFDYLLSLVDNLYRDKNFLFDARFTDTRSLIEQVVCLLSTDKIAEATRLFLRKFFTDEELGIYNELLIEIWELALQKPFSQTLELLEIAAQNSLLSAPRLPDHKMEKIHSLFIGTAEKHHSIDPDFKNHFTSRLLKSAGYHLETGNFELYSDCKKMVDELAALRS